jgi:hypothetical protein
MKKLALTLFFMSAAVFAQTLESANVAGKWKVHTSMAGSDTDQDCTFTQKDSDFTGECTSDQGTVKIKGKVDGKNITWSYDSEYSGTPLTVKYTGKFDSGKIAGDAAVDQFGVSGDFTATQAK